MLGLYRNVSASSGVEDASPHKLVAMLYEAVTGEIAAARGALQRRDVAEKGMRSVTPCGSSKKACSRRSI